MLYNLKVNITNMTKRINILQRRNKQKVETERELTRVDHKHKRILRELSRGKTVLKKVGGHTFIISPSVAKVSRSASPQMIGILGREPSFTCFDYGERPYTLLLSQEEKSRFQRPHQVWRAIDIDTSMGAIYSADKREGNPH